MWRLLLAVVVVCGIGTGAAFAQSYVPGGASPFPPSLYTGVGAGYFNYPSYGYPAYTYPTTQWNWAPPHSMRYGISYPGVMYGRQYAYPSLPGYGPGVQEFLYFGGADFYGW